MGSRGIAGRVVGLGPVVVGVLSVALVAWVGYELSRWPGEPPGRPSAVAAPREGVTSSAEPSTPSPAAPPEGGRWLLAGGSYAAGVGADAPGRTGFPQVLDGCLDAELRVLADRGAGYLAEGASGTVGTGLRPALRRARPPVVVFAAGLDDRTPVVDGGAGVEALRTAAAQVWQQAEDSGAEVVVVGPFWPASTLEPGIASVRDALADEARDHGYPFADPTGWLGADPAGDLVDPAGYPTEEGHRVLGTRLADELVGLGLAESTSC